MDEQNQAQNTGSSSPKSSGGGAGKLIGGIVVLAVIVVAGYYFLQSREEHPSSEQMATSPNQSTPTNNNTTTNPPVNPPASEVKSFTVTAQGLSFSPKEIKVKKGDTVQIKFVNAGGFHDLRIDGYNVGTKQIQSPGEETFQFVADKAGTFEFFCSVMNHRQLGMKGNLIVE